ncbi:hypothetical protein C8R44DRAFT_886528 [Mycena epipterygia]|nr:hypothetical protein C8R44DRAFT_886528 [Mycena epipterygia]
MHATSTTVLTVQLAADALATVANTASTTKEAVPVNHNSNGPTCAHCGWRGGGHASNCPFSTRLLPPPPFPLQS